MLTAIHPSANCHPPIPHPPTAEQGGLLAGLLAGNAHGTFVQVRDQKG
jgi:hypothetical protein